MADRARARRLAVRIHEIVARELEHRVKDPRLGMVTITDGRVTPDLREATLFYTVFGDETAVAESAEALDSARGVLRSAVGKQTGIKFVPTLAFERDEVPETAQDIEEALARAKQADAELAKARENAAYAGEADPYRKPRVIEDDDESDDGTVSDRRDPFGDISFDDDDSIDGPTRSTADRAGS